MTDKEQKIAEISRTGERAAYAAEIAAVNIRKYNELHSNTLNRYVMKVADEMLEASAQVAQQSIETAKKGLDNYLALINSKD